jgi:hypothetical protein
MASQSLADLWLGGYFRPALLSLYAVSVSCAVAGCGSSGDGPQDGAGRGGLGVGGTGTGGNTQGGVPSASGGTTGAGGRGGSDAGGGGGRAGEPTLPETGGSGSGASGAASGGSGTNTGGTAGTVSGGTAGTTTSTGGAGTGGASGGSGGSGPPRDPFDVVTNGTAVDIYVDAADSPTVVRAVGDLRADVQRVSGTLPTVKNSTTGLSTTAILVGTLGKSPTIDALVTAGKLDTTGVAGKWESAVIQAVANPVAGVSRALVIAGSDRRGTVYGIYELSQRIGVSPWYWWADVAPTQTKTITVDGSLFKQGEPTVKYRGIFINDEENFTTWAATKVDAGKKPGPETYKKVFELLLRLKANFLWPAMHPVSEEFNKYTENAANADLYGIVMGSSHPEMMLRNNVKEWEPWARSHGSPAYDYSVNPQPIYDYWDARVQTNGKYENGYSVGMRGEHDSGLVAANAPSTADKVKLMEKIFADQRKILSTRVNTDLTKIFQVFTPYKEVLPIYNAGLKVPDDVTILWAEDNHGYVRQLPTAAERMRSGGAGVYYHISYWGAPTSYLWVNSTPLTLVREELQKAYDTGANKLWVINVGDIKPAEMALEFTMRFAWRVTDITESNVAKVVADQAARDFGASAATEIADVVMRYYQINIARRPEFMGKTTFSYVNEGDEGQKRLDELTALLTRATAVSDSLPANKKDAFYEMVLYPIRASKLQNEKYIAAGKTDLYAAQGRTASVTKYRSLATAAYDTIRSDLTYYNNTLAGGKWQKMMDPYNNGNGQPVIEGMPALAAVPATSGTLGVACEGQTTGNEATTLKFSVYTDDRRFIDVFTKGASGFSWTATTSQPWIKLSKASGTLTDEDRLWASIDWAMAPAGDSTGTITITAGSATKTVSISAANPATPTRNDLEGYVESNGYVAIEAENFTSKVDRGSAEWRVFKQLGRSGDSVQVLPHVSASVTSNLPTTSPELGYKIYFFTTGTFNVTVYRIPTLNTTGSCRLAIGLDNATPQTLTGVRSAEESKWQTNVLEHIEKLSGKIEVTTPGYHTLKLFKVDPSIAVDRIVIDTGGLRPSYLGPPESYHR